jgi:hypothetical protein
MYAASNCGTSRAVSLTGEKRSIRIMRMIRLITVASFLLTGAAFPAYAVANQPQQLTGTAASADSDGDGLSDLLEQTLLERFAPAFLVSRRDCANVPALFVSGQTKPVVQAENGAIYGQATPQRFERGVPLFVELHYYHLWSRDCGRMGHPLDTEHVSVLLKRNRTESGPQEWKAVYWYAAAHEDTVCDASQMARASTLHAEERGAKIWISRGKHASFFNEELCRHGCGGDLCEQMEPLAVSAIVNLGENAKPMNDTLWSASSQWPLATKMGRSDFQPAALARLERLPHSDIAWVNPSKRPAQSTIAAGGSTVDALETSNRNTDSAISLAGGATGGALGTTYRSVTKALGKSARGVGKFLRIEPASNAKKDDPRSKTETP